MGKLETPSDGCYGRYIVKAKIAKQQQLRRQIGRTLRRWKGDDKVMKGAVIELRRMVVTLKEINTLQALNSAAGSRE